MNRALAVAALLLASVPAAPRAQVAVSVHVGLPVAPPLVVVQPGIQVVENYDEEVFVTGGWYWLRRDGRWYRAHGPRAAFVYVEPRRVPARLVRLPPGQYRHWQKAEVKQARHAAKAERHAWKHEGPDQGHGGHGHGHGHGHD